MADDAEHVNANCGAIALRQPRGREGNYALQKSSKTFTRCLSFAAQAALSISADIVRDIVGAGSLAESLAGRPYRELCNY